MAASDKITLEDLEKELSSVKSKWYQIGLFLKVDKEKLESFKLKHKKSGSADKESLCAVLSTYMSTESNPSWSTIVNCLRSAEVACTKVAEKIEKKHGTGAPANVEGRN